MSGPQILVLDEAAKRTFGGLLGWAWPWAHGNHGPLGTVAASGFPIAGFFVAMTAAGLSLIVMGLFLDVTKLLPIAADAFVLATALTDRVPLAIS